MTASGLKFTRKCKAAALKMIVGLCLAVLPAAMSAPAAYGEIPVPRLKPVPLGLSTYLSDSDARIFRAALNATKHRKWDAAERYESQISDPIARDVIVWIRAQKDISMSLSELTYVVQNLSDWPRMVTIQARAEEKLFEYTQPPRETLTWFEGRMPVSGEGRAALAKAHYKLGNISSGDFWLRKAWREAKLTRDGQKEIYSQYKSRLTKADHAARADYLIWQGSAHFSKVSGLLSLMEPGQRALMDARMRVLANRRGMDAAINKVPAALQTDPGLLYARGKWRRQKKTKAYALPVYLQIKEAPLTEKGRERLWRERKIMAYWALEQGNIGEAYQLSLNHGFDKGVGFAEAEFLAGWLALTKLGDPDKAIEHFERLRGGVSYPVSISRAGYWLGRAYEAKGDAEAANYYGEASRFTNTFYGFLAADKIGGQNLLVSLPYEHQDAVLTSASLVTDRRFRAMQILAEAGEETYYTQFSFHMDDTVASPEELSTLAQMGKEYGYMKPSVRAAKQASRFQTMLTESGYPMPEAILNLDSRKFDRPFVLAIARQESEFNLSAVSHARAYGMMQMINSTAKTTARRHRIPYSRSRLTTDIDYSAKLGALHLNDLLDDFDGSYILASAAYNAGGHRARQWMRDFGDPRTGEIDPVDWLESIPFTETRNYIQRVMENMQVYRARMNGNSAHNQVQRDITQGAL